MKTIFNGHKYDIDIEAYMKDEVQRIPDSFSTPPGRLHPP
jgi:hypothetical protein